MNQENKVTALEAVQASPAEKDTHNKADYMEKILSLSPEDQAFMDGYLFAKVTECAKGA